METKKCSKCGEVKDVDLFEKGMGQCKECVRIYQKKWRKENKEKVAAYNKKWNEENKDKLAACQKKWHEENKDKLAAYKKTHREKNKEKVAAYKKTHREKNKEKVAAYQKKYHKKQSGNLTDSYISGALNMPISECPPELIEAKRIQLMIHRKLKALKK